MTKDTIIHNPPLYMLYAVKTFHKVVKMIEVTNNSIYN